MNSRCEREHLREGWHRDFEQALSKLVEALKKQLNPEQIILFGSWAKDEFHQSSDIDILIIKDTNKRWVERIVEARLAVPDEVAIKYNVDILVYNRDEFEELSRERRFVREIKESGKVIYERETGS